jgi:hypothetical protein
VGDHRAFAAAAKEDWPSIIRGQDHQFSRCPLSSGSEQANEGPISVEARSSIGARERPESAQLSRWAALTERVLMPEAVEKRVM